MKIHIDIQIVIILSTLFAIVFLIAFTKGIYILLTGNSEDWATIKIIHPIRGLLLYDFILSINTILMILIVELLFDWKISGEHYIFFTILSLVPSGYIVYLFWNTSFVNLRKRADL